MQYREGFGFVLSEDEQNDMAKLGIGQRPVDPNEQRIQQEQLQYQQQQVQEQIQQQPIQEQQSYAQPVISENDRKQQVDAYMAKVMGIKAETPVQPETQPVMQQQAKNDDFLSSLFEAPVSEPVREQAIEQPKQQYSEPVIQYRKSIVEKSIEMGLNPEDIERTIASMTPEEQVILAKIKLDYDNQRRMNTVNPGTQVPQQQPMQQGQQPIVFQSLKQKPVPSAITVPSVNFNQPKTDTYAVKENLFRNKFYS